jgi:hypothetical protein
LASFVFRHALLELGMVSSLTRNLFCCSQRFCVASDVLLSRKVTTSDLLRMWHGRLPIEDIVAAGATLELLLAREGHFVIDRFSRIDIESCANLISASN